MGLESATYVSDLTATNPPSTDKRKQGDDHLRLIKTVLKSTFPNASKAWYFREYEAATTGLTVDATDMNRMFVASTAGGAFQITLPTNLGAGAAGFTVGILKLETNTDAVTIAPTSGTINGDASVTLYTKGALCEAIWTGTAWVAAVSNPPASTTAAGDVELATVAEIQANSADRALMTNAVWSAGALTTLTDAATIAVDMATGLNFTVTLGANRTLGQPTNTKVNQSGFIRIIQDATGSRTLAYHADWKFAGGSDPVLSTAANAIDLLYYTVIATNFIHGSLIKALA
jgi:hypothetical protein